MQPLLLHPNQSNQLENETISASGNINRPSPMRLIAQPMAAAAATIRWID